MRTVQEKQVPDIIIGNNTINADDEYSWIVWKKMKNKLNLRCIVGLVDSLLTTIEEIWATFLLHTYYNRQQRYYIKELRS